MKKQDELIILDFPTSTLSEIQFPENIEKTFGKLPEKCIKGREDLMLVFNSEEDIKNLQPDFSFMKTLDARGVIATAKSENFDFVSRFFAPLEGIDEDPVTGSAHTVLIPFWSEALGKKEMIARQISARGGTLHCKYSGDRVEIGGRAVTYLTGEIQV